ATTTFTVGTANATLTATYINQYTLNVTNGSGSGAYLANEVVNIVASATPSGMRFAQWTGDVANVANVNNPTTTFTIGTANANISASYVNEYTLTVNSGSGSGVYLTNQVINLVANAAPAGMRFTQWTGDVTNVANVNNATTTFTVGTTNANLTANYVNEYTITVNSGSGSGIYLTNEVINLVANTPPTGMRFAHWTGDVTNVANVNNSSTSFNVGNANATLTATYVNQYTVNVSSGSGSGTYLTNEVISIVANTAPSGQRFDKWTGDVANVANVNNATTTFIVGTANATITATYIAEYSLNVNGGSGTGVYITGSVVNIAANTAPAGQTFDKWTGDVSAIANVQDPTTTLTLNATSSITATYKDIVVYYEDFNPVEGTWLYSTAAGGNDWKLTAAVGTNGTDGLRSKYVVNTNYAISKGIALKAGEQYKISFNSKAATASNRKISASFNTVQSITGQIAIFTTPFIGTVFAEYSSAFTVPSDNTYYLSLSGSGATATYVFLYIDDLKVVVDTTLALRSASIQPENERQSDLISLSPNPATNGYTVLHTNSATVSPIQIMDMYGRIVSLAKGAGDVLIPTQGLAPGVYLVKVKNKVLKLQVK
ncbi:MAG: T9SS type A sorting domain-containing protein, partial [Bacteroidales bacterium]